MGRRPSEFYSFLKRLEDNPEKKDLTELLCVGMYWTNTLVRITFVNLECIKVPSLPFLIKDLR